MLSNPLDGASAPVQLGQRAGRGRADRRRLAEVVARAVVAPGS